MTVRTPTRRGRRASDPLWARAPLLLARLPRVALALCIGAVLLSLAAAGYPLMLSARTTKLLHERIADPAVTPFGAGITYATVPQGSVRGFATRAETPAEIGDAFARGTADASLGGPVQTELGPVVRLSSAAGASTEGRLFAGDAVFSNVTVLERPDGDGVWLSELAAGALHLERGATVTITGPDERSTADVRIAAIYRARVGEPRSGYFQAWDQEIYPTCGECPVPAPFVLVTSEQIERLGRELRLGPPARAWQAPVVDDLTLDDARRIASLAERLQSLAGVPGADLPCCRSGYLRDGTIVTPRLTSSMPRIVRRAEGEVAGIAGPGRLLQITAVAVALAVIAISAGLGHAARRTEFHLLFSRGVGVGTVAARSAVEAVVPSLAGGVGGLAVGLAVVPFLGDGARTSSAALAGAATGALIAVAVSTIVVAAVSTVAYARQGDARGRVAAIAGRVPWELGVAGLAIVAFVRLRSGGAFAADPSTGVRAPALGVLLFPILTIGAAATLVARAAIESVARARARTDRSPPWLFLAVRRVVADAGPSLLFVAAAASCLGVFVLSQTIVGSLRETVDAKARLFVGSDVQASVLYDAPAIGRFPFPLTRVTSVPAAATLVPGGAQVDLLAIDPKTFPAAAYWRGGLSNLPLERLVSTLDDADGSALPVLVAGHDGDVARLDLGGRPLDVRVAATASAFPGISSARPLVVVSADQFLRRFPEPPNPLRSAGASTQLWIRGETAPVVAALRDLRYPPSDVVTAEEVADIPHIAIVIDTFSVLELLGTLAAVLVVASVLMYLQARQRSQLVSYGLSLRMGLGDAPRRWSVLAEVLAVLGVAFVVGLGVAVAVSAALLPMLDPLPAIAPAPFLELPAVRLVAVFAAILGCAWAAARLTQRSARSADLGQVMRGVE